MKKIYILILSIFTLLSCENEETLFLDYPINGLRLEPSTPNLVFPTNNLVCTNFELEFQWKASTSDIENSIGYLVEISASEDFADILFSASTASTSRVFNLEKGVKYYWRVKAKDEKGYQSKYSSIQSFITEPEAGTNTAPYPPRAVTPSEGAMISDSRVTLEWNATDQDNDALVYDIYFGENNPPELVEENVTTTSFDVSVSPATQYYWRVIAKDDHQGVALGQVWSFTTN